jgi:DNA-binding LacI/PurR family transcriptional regulator
MKYRVVKEDNLLDYVNLTQLAKKVGCSPAMLCRVRKGERVMSERLYQKVKKALKE